MSSPAAALRAARILHAYEMGMLVLQATGGRPFRPSILAGTADEPRYWICRNIGRAGELHHRILWWAEGRFLELLAAAPDHHRTLHVAQALMWLLPVLPVADRAGRLWPESPIHSALTAALSPRPRWFANSWLIECLDGALMRRRQAEVMATLFEIESRSFGH